MLTCEDVPSELQCLDGEMALLTKLLYGTGMRLMEGLRLRIKDVDFDHRAIIVHAAEGGKERVLMVPQTLAPTLGMLARRLIWLSLYRRQASTQRPPNPIPREITSFMISFVPP